MQKEFILLILGFMVFLAPLLGVPESWRAGLLFGLGGCIIVVALLYRVQTRRKDRNQEHTLHREHDPHAEPLTTPR